jgi:general secretion pathway protein A
MEDDKVEDILEPHNSDITPNNEQMQSTPVPASSPAQPQIPGAIPVFELPPKKLTAPQWLDKMGWKQNPFTFSIMPDLFVGYKPQFERVMMALDERHKFVYLAGPTGSGKTTMLKWLMSNLGKNIDCIYIAKPPERPHQLIDVINSKYKNPWFAFWKKEIKSIYEIPQFLNEKLKSKYLVVMFDEAHESNLDVLEWLRVLSDQVENMSVVLSGLPVFEAHLKDKLETFRKRIAAKIELVSLTKEEMQDMIRKRIAHVGGSGNEFSQELLDFIFVQSGGFPREILRICDELVNQAILSGKMEFAVSKEEQKEAAAQVSLSIVDEMTPMQKDVIECLAKNPMTPGEIANTINLEKYKSRQHAVRSINNIMKKLYEDGYLDRRRSDKAYVYSLSGKLRTIVVKA